MFRFFLVLSLVISLCSGYDSNQPYICVRLYTSTDRTGTEKEMCEGDPTTVSPWEYNDKFQSFELDCDIPCFVTFWGGSAGNYDYPPSPLTFESESEPTGSFSDNEIGGSGVSAIEIKRQDRCVQLFDDYGQRGRSIVVCRGSSSLPDIIRYKVKSFRFLCGDEECVVIMYDGNDYEEYDKVDYHSHEEGDDIHDLRVDRVEVEFSYNFRFKSAPPKGINVGAKSASTQLPQKFQAKGQNFGAKGRIYGAKGRGRKGVKFGAKGKGPKKAALPLYRYSTGIKKSHPGQQVYPQKGSTTLPRKYVLYNVYNLNKRNDGKTKRNVGEAFAERDANFQQEPFLPMPNYLF